MPENTKTLRERSPVRLAGVLAAFFAFVAPPAPADPDVTPAEGGARSAVSPVLPDDGASGKRKLKLDHRAHPPRLRIVLPSLSEEEKRFAPGSKTGGGFTIGFHRAVPAPYKNDLSGRLRWTELFDGSFVASLTVTSPGAASVRAGLRAELPPGGEIRFFGEGSDERFAVVTPDDFYFVEGEIETLWSPTLDGDTIGIEISLPSGKARDAFRLTVDAVAHTLLSTEEVPTRLKLDCPSLHIDVACRSSQIHGNKQNAVGRIRFEKGGRSALCSGTLLNDKVDGSFIPYFLTANHCVAAGSVARTVEAWWFYQTARCGGSALDSRNTRSTGGTDLLSTRSASDMSLLRFRRALPGGLVLSGWSPGSLRHPAAVYGIHHPSGEEKSYSAGNTTGSRDSRAGDSPTVRNAIQVRWSVGTTESGSSGSGLFRRSDGRLVGALSHGPNCGPGITDNYGPFRDFFPQIARWIDDGNGGDIRDDHGNTPAAATAVGRSSSTAGNLERGGDRDYFRFTLPAAGALRVYTTGTTDTHGTLTRSGSTDTWRNDDGVDRNFRISVPRAPAGTYHVEVKGFRTTTTGTYTLHVRSDLAANTGPPDVVLPLVTEASNFRWRGVMRVMNLSSRAGTIDIQGIDDTGRRFGPITMSVPARASRNLESGHLENGSSAHGLSGGIGNGNGHWRVELRSELEIDALAFIRTPDGLQTSMHLAAQESSAGSMRYYVPMFNPANVPAFSSWLRVANPNSESVNVTITGWDARGNPAPGGSVRLTLSGLAARMVSAEHLEGGHGSLSGRLGNGQGKWRLQVSGNRPLQVMSLMQTPSGHLSNVSR